jgi:hypothetical protein
MKRLWIIVAAVLVPFGALVAFGLSKLDSPSGGERGDSAPPPPPVPVGLPVAPGQIQPGNTAREGIARALAPTTPAAPGVPVTRVPTREVGAAPVAPPVAAQLGQLAPTSLDEQSQAIAARPRPVSALGKDQGQVLVPPPRQRGGAQVMESPNKNGFPPQVAAAAARLSVHCWTEHQERAPKGAPVQVMVLAQPMPDGRWYQTRVSWSSWNDPLFMACVEDAIHEGSFPPGEQLPAAPVLHTLEFAAAP